MNWHRQNMSEDSILYRARMKAPETKFTIHEEKVLVGWSIYLDLVMQSSTTDKLREYGSLIFIFSYFFVSTFRFFSTLYFYPLILV